MDMESHMVLAYHNEGTSSKPIHSQQQDNLMSKGQWGVASTTTTLRPCWPTTVPTRSSVSAAAAVFSNNNSDESSSSWEVRAFAEDAASCSGQWPPRSYTCSFCQREFRTAQALGGHMNVHRRERAEANELALQQQQQQQLHHHHHQVTPPLPLPPPPAAAVQWWYAPSPAPIPIPVPMATKTSPVAAEEEEEDEEVGPYLFAAAAGGGGVTPSILHFPNCKTTVMNKLYMGGAFQPYQSRQGQETAAVPPEEDNLDLELRLGPSMICGQ